MVGTLFRRWRDWPWGPLIFVTPGLSLGTLSLIAQLSQLPWTADERFAASVCLYPRGYFMEAGAAIKNCFPKRFHAGTDASEWERFARGSHLIIKDQIASDGVQIRGYVLAFDTEKGPKRWRVDVGRRRGKIVNIPLLTLTEIGGHLHKA